MRYKPLFSLALEPEEGFRANTLLLLWVHCSENKLAKCQNGKKVKYIRKIICWEKIAFCIMNFSMSINISKYLWFGVSFCYSLYSPKDCLVSVLKSIYQVDAPYIFSSSLPI